MKKVSFSIITSGLAVAALCYSCAPNNASKSQKIDIMVDQFADIQVLRYEVTGFEELSLQHKKLIYYLSQAAIEGRDILFDQNCRYNLLIRKTLEAVYEHYKGDRTSSDWNEFMIYLKRVWFSNGIHHHYGEEKFVPGFSQKFIEDAILSIDVKYLPFSLEDEETIAKLTQVVFDPAVLSKRVNRAQDMDIIVNSANNYYYDITQTEVESFYDKMIDKADERPISYGLNSRLTKENGDIVEQIWKIDGMYSPAIEKIVYWLEKAATVSENEQQKAAIDKLVSFYKTGCLREYDEYSILWLQDINSLVDFVNGFTETYGDPLGIKASWESIVNFKDVEATRRTEILSGNAQWFEDNSPVDKRFKKEEVKGVTAKVITAAMLGGDCYPATAIGINLPNSNWIRKEYGSKSVTIENITAAYDKASQGSGFAEEFYWSDAERDIVKKYGFLTDNLHTDMHECIGHGSGKMLPGVGDDALKAYGSVIEESRADLFGLYYIADTKMIEIGLIPDAEAYKAQYYKYLCNGLMTQLTRIELGKQIEQSHMRNRALIARWIFEKAETDNIAEMRNTDGKTFLVINDYVKLRELFGQLLAEIQRIKSEGDFLAAKNLVETYAIKIDPVLHEEILERYKKLNISPYKGFVNPAYKPVYDANGEIIDVTIDYSESFAEQMMRYGKENSWL